MSGFCPLTNQRARSRRSALFAAGLQLGQDLGHARLNHGAAVQEVAADVNARFAGLRPFAHDQGGGDLRGHLLLLLLELLDPSGQWQTLGVDLLILLFQQGPLLVGALGQRSGQGCADRVGQDQHLAIAGRDRHPKPAQQVAGLVVALIEGE